MTKPVQSNQSSKSRASAKRKERSESKGRSVKQDSDVSELARAGSWSKKHNQHPDYAEDEFEQLGALDGAHSIELSSAQAFETGKCHKSYPLPRLPASGDHEACAMYIYRTASRYHSCGVSINGPATAITLWKDLHAHFVNFHFSFDKVS